jgi:hypothetical protein
MLPLLLVAVTCTVGADSIWPDDVAKRGEMKMVPARRPTL